METDKTNLFISIIFILLIGNVTGLHNGYVENDSKLFIFGDSYADTGNFLKSVTGSWKPPYGFTFPGKPAGRFSDGRVLTDYLAHTMGIPSPVPYRWKNDVGPRTLRYGMNFAFGGTGVFDTLNRLPNMTTQINFLERLIQNGVYTKRDLQSSVVLISLAGNDYLAYQARNGTVEGAPAFVQSIVNQLTLNLKRVNALGIKKIAMTGLEPMGCLPVSSAISSYQLCNETLNNVALLHNALLRKAVESINNSSRDRQDSSTIVFLDLYTAFMSIFQNKGKQGPLKFDDSMKPCCVGLTAGSNCGHVDEQGNKKYTVCARPEATFFWDGVHPTQAGWTALTSYLHSVIQLFSP